MARKILLTSFKTWLPHQSSNSSDDLLAQIPKHLFSDRYFILVRGLPVDIEKASQRLTLAIKVLQPDAIVCCGMAESRSQLTVESNACRSRRRLKTAVNLSALTANLPYTAISHDAGKFVCEGLYYEVLNDLEILHLPLPCIFVHVPLLTAKNQPQILRDFLAILQRI